MDLPSQKQAAALAALSAADSARLERLASKANVSVDSIWPEIYVYGFDDIEDSVQANLNADEDIAAGCTVAHDDVMAQARRILDANVRGKRKAG